MTRAVDSSTVGDDACFLAFTSLVERLASFAPAPRDRGSVGTLVTRVANGRRELLPRAELSAAGGMPGDAWNRKKPALAEAQLAVMQRDVAELIANGQPLALFGDNVFLDLDLTAANLPIGSRLRAGAALLEVTPKAHNGCHKFKGRFGTDALRFVAHPERRHLNLRGIYLRVGGEGGGGGGDVGEVVMRAPAS